jgi:predicted nucleic acid-binding protein
MILVDTSVWIDHFRRGNATLERLLTEGLVFMHPSVLGELACGNLQKRSTVLHLLAALPCARVVEHHELLLFLEARKLYGIGLGWTDIGLLASAQLTGCGLWTLDKSLAGAAAKLGLAP